MTARRVAAPGVRLAGVEGDDGKLPREAETNTATLAAFSVAQERNLGIGRDVALVGFDDSAWMAHFYPPVAAIVQPVEALAEAAWRRLLSRIEEGAAPAGTLRLPCQLEPRGTLVAARTHIRSAGRNGGAVH